MSAGTLDSEKARLLHLLDTDRTTESGQRALMREGGGIVQSTLARLSPEAFTEWINTEFPEDAAQRFAAWVTVSRKTDEEIDALAAAGYRYMIQQGGPIPGTSPADRLNELHRQIALLDRDKWAMATEAGSIVRQQAELAGGDPSQWLAENFTGSAGEAGVYLLRSSLTPETFGAFQAALEKATADFFHASQAGHENDA